MPTNLLDLARNAAQLVLSELGWASEDPRVAPLLERHPADASLDPAWVRADLSAALAVDDGLPPSGDPESFLRSLRPNRGPEWEDWGFGLRSGVAFNAGGHVSFITRAATFEGRLAAVRVTCSVDEPNRSKLAPLLALVLRDAFRPCAAGFVADYAFAEVMAALDTALAAALGPRPPVDVPEALREGHAALTSPTASFGYYPPEQAFDDGGPLEFRTARALEAAGRLDLLRDVLRGPNPTGRRYAAAALERLGAVDAADARTIEALRASSAPLTG